MNNKEKITFEEAVKTFIPEYVECIISSTDAFTKNKIYKIKNLVNLKYPFNLLDDNNSLRNVIMDGGLWSFKPSTKEAYNSQFVVKNEFVLPEKWCILRNEYNYITINKWCNENHLIGEICSYVDNTNRLIYSERPFKSWSGYGRFCNFTDTTFTEITFEQFKKYVLKEETVVEYPINTKVLNTQTNTIYTRKENGWYKPEEKTGYNDYMITKSNYIDIVEKNNIIEPLPQFKIIESIETITKVENNEGSQFFIGDVVKSLKGVIYTIAGFERSFSGNNVLIITSNKKIIGINKIEHYIEPKVEVKDLFYYFNNGTLSEKQFCELSKSKVKEETLLEKAKRLYPVGTKFKSATTNKLFTVKDHNEQYINSGRNICFNTIEPNESNNYYGCIRSIEGRWAEIIK